MDDSGFTFTDSAFKHGIKKDVSLGIIASPFLSKRKKGSDVILVFGFDDSGQAIEVLYDAVRRVVFHAMPVNVLKMR